MHTNYNGTPYLCSNAACDHATRRAPAATTVCDQNEAGAWRQTAVPESGLCLSFFLASKNSTFGSSQVDINPLSTFGLTSQNPFCNLCRCASRACTPMSSTWLSLQGSSQPNRDRPTDQPTDQPQPPLAHAHSRRREHPITPSRCSSEHSRALLPRRLCRAHRRPSTQ